MATVFHWALILAICASHRPRIPPTLARLLSDLTQLVFYFGREREGSLGAGGVATAPADLAGAAVCIIWL